MKGELGREVIRGSESWQFFAFVFAALSGVALALLEELPDTVHGGGRVLLKVGVFAAIGYVTLFSVKGRNWLVGVLNCWKKERHS
jgi:hypothetical protein